MVLGNVAILVGSGIAGTVLTSGGDAKSPKSGGVLATVSNFMKKHSKEGKDTPPKDDAYTAQLISQVNNLRAEIQSLGSRQVTVVTNAARSGPGAFTITAVVVTGVIGYAYIRWKGWKLSDMMFVTKRGLSDACNVVGNQLNQVSDNVTDARKHLAGRIDRVDISLDETQLIIEGTRDEVTVIHGDLSAFHEDLQSVNRVVRDLESKLVNFEYIQDRTANGITDLVEFTQQMEHGQKANIRQIPATTPLAIGSSSERIVRRAISLPPPPEAPQTVLPAAESSHTVETSQTEVPQTVLPAVGSSHRVGTSQNVVSRRSPGTGGLPAPSIGASSSTEASTSTPNTSTSRFGGLRLPGLGFLRSSAC